MRIRAIALTRSLLAAALFISVSLACAGAAAAADPPFTFVVHTAPQGAVGAYLSADGRVVAGSLGGAATDKRPVYWVGDRPAEAFVPIPMPNDPNAVMARTTAISGNGKVIAGYYGLSDYPQDYARIWRHQVGDSITTRITSPSNPTIGANDAQVTAINYDGSVIVGRYFGSATGSSNGGFRRTADGVVHPLDILFPNAVSPDGSIVVGGVGNSGSIWREAGNTLTNLPFGATALTPDGSIVGGSSTFLMPQPGGGNLLLEKAVLWQQGTLTELGDLPGGNYRSEVSDLSADGTIAVGSSDGGDIYNAYIWDAAHGMRSIQSMVSDAGYDLTGLWLNDAVSISDDGVTIAGTGLDVAHSNLGFVWVINPVVPEPSSAIALLTIGTLSASMIRRKSCRQRGMTE